MSVPAQIRLSRAVHTPVIRLLISFKLLCVISDNNRDTSVEKCALILLDSMVFHSMPDSSTTLRDEREQKQANLV